MTKTIKNILIPVNFSESSEAAISTGIAMCKRHKAALHLLFVKQNQYLIYPPGKNPQILEMVLEAEIASLARLEAQASQIEKANDITCFYHQAEGPFDKAVAIKAADFYCDLIILEKSKRAGLFKLKKANTPYKILKMVTCPVLTIPAEKKFLNFKHILFPVRPLIAGLEKLDTAMPIMKKNSSKVLLFSAIKKANRAHDLPIITELINRAFYRMSINQIEIEKEENLTSDVAKEVVNKAVEKNSDLIVITASIRTGLKGMFNKNYTEKVLEFSPVPVLSVKLK